MLLLNGLKDNVIAVMLVSMILTLDLLGEKQPHRSDHYMIVTLELQVENSGQGGDLIVYVGYTL